MITWTRTAERLDEVETRLSMPMLVLSLALLPVVIVQLVDSSLTTAEKHALAVADLLIWVGFIAEYVVLLALAPSRRHFVRTHVLELVLIAVPVLRPLRVVRAARGARLLRLTRTTALAGKTFKESRRSLAQRGVIYVTTVAAVLLVVCAGLVLAFEKSSTTGNIHSFGTAVWWATVTVTTIGYGDHYPVTAAGRVVASVLSIAGIALVGTVTAAIAAWFVRVGQEEQRERDIEERETEMEEIAEADIDLRDIHQQLGTLSLAVEQLAQTVAELHRQSVPTSAEISNV